MMVKEIQEVSRRGFLALGAAVGAVWSPLRRLGGSSREATRSDPTQPGGGGEQGKYSRHYYSLVGGATVDGFVATTQLDMVFDVGKQVNLVVSLSQIKDKVDGLASFSGRVDSAGLVRHTTSGLQNNRHYFCRLTDRYGRVFGDEFRAWTGVNPNPTVSYSLGMILGSCQSNPGDRKSQLALQDAQSWADARVLLHLGDWGYWGQNIGVDPSDPLDFTNDLKKYISHNIDRSYYPDTSAIRAILHQTNLEGVCISDHELHNNGDSWQPGYPDDSYGCPHSIRQLGAHQRLFPVRTWGDTRHEPVHRAYFTDLAPHLRLVVSDFRSPQRNLASDPDGPSKSMWGKDQERFLYERGGAFDVPDDVAILFVNETSWWRASEIVSDKPASYPAAQDRFMDRLRAEGEFAGYNRVIDRFVWLGGDRHYCGWLSRPDAESLGDGFPQFIASGWSKAVLKMHHGEFMTDNTPPLVDEAQFEVAQYMQLTASYDHGAGTVTVRGQARAAAPTHYTVPDVDFDRRSRVVTSWTGFTDPGGDLPKVGVSIDSELVENGTRILRIVDEHTIVMSRQPKQSGKGILTTVGYPTWAWRMSDFNGGHSDWVDVIRLRQ